MGAAWEKANGYKEVVGKNQFILQNISTTCTKQDKAIFKLTMRMK